MLAYQLKNRLEHLILAGYQDGEYIWVQTPQQWQVVKDADREFEEASI